MTAKAYRRVALYEPGGTDKKTHLGRRMLMVAEYTAILSYYGNETTVATWTVRDIEQVRKTKNILFFIGDGMTTNMITVSRITRLRNV